ncbi:BT1926 family outer membrane beta-barrel protein [Flavivirga amylovorans]|uniref:BT1926 family outer membrane beta-barrel protein n=1 Tax=Flavivirga amylovorans TaxID=870486 RepID=A0ABT8WYK7_9FLAO|nr:BT1926 family outer membrane beta-barrel protein [Flavivirga amylovorans]MDO5986776.1 BT1926 family outer membrane beta-barrel protein [Flavivirga amylovorans]
MKKIFLAIFVLLFSMNMAIAQDKKAIDYRPDKGSFTVSLLLGKGVFLDSGSATSIGNNVVNGAAPTYTTLSNNNNNLTNMVGVEGKYFLSNKTVLTLTGGVSYRNTPSLINIPEVRDTTGDLLVPGYSAVLGEDDIDVHVAPGVQFYYELKSPRLLPYFGFALPFDYSRSTVFDPTVDADNNILSYGNKHVELVGVGVHGVAGLDYYLTPDLFIGFDVKPVTFNYLINTKKPRPGTLGRQAENYSLSFFSHYIFKIGFKLN